MTEPGLKQGKRLKLSSNTHLTFDRAIGSVDTLSQARVLKNVYQMFSTYGTVSASFTERYQSVSELCPKIEY